MTRNANPPFLKDNLRGHLAFPKKKISFFVSYPIFSFSFKNGSKVEEIEKAQTSIEHKIILQENVGHKGVYQHG